MEEAEVYPGSAGTRQRRRVFTLEQANKTLPLVSRIVGDVVALYERMAGTQQRLATEPSPSGTREQLEAVAEEQEMLFDRYIDELAEVGCELKDAKMGLVDFVGRHDGRDVCLCWRLGEEGIGFWHELHTGFAGRREVACLREP